MDVTVVSADQRMWHWVGLLARMQDRRTDVCCKCSTGSKSEGRRGRSRAKKKASAVCLTGTGVLGKQKVVEVVSVVACRRAGTVKDQVQRSN